MSERAELPTLRTERLILRPFSSRDAPRVRELAGAEAVASTTLRIPHPYEEGMAERWIEGHVTAWVARSALNLAVTTGADGLVGAVGLGLVGEHHRGELGYWIGVPHWNRGFATEAATAVVGFAFGELGLHRVQARHFPRNRASARVLRKLGMTHEGTLREHVMRFDRFQDLACYAVLAKEWEG